MGLVYFLAGIVLGIAIGWAMFKEHFHGDQSQQDDKSTVVNGDGRAYGDFTIKDKFAP